MAATDLRIRPAGSSTRPAGAAPSWRVGRHVGRRAIVSVLAWAFAFGLYVVGSVSGYAAAYRTQAARAALARSFGSNAGIAALIGPARSIDTVAGFASWRCLGVLSLVGAVWAVLAGTRLLRGEEEDGRWELLLAGPTTRRQAAAQGVAGLGAGWATLLGITALFAVAAGQSAHPAFGVRASLFFALALAASAAVFLAVAALSGQVAATRRQAATLAGAVLGASYLIRALADADPRLAWLLWATPLGWVEHLHPLTGSHPLALIPIAALVGILALASVHLAGRRDLGAATLPDHQTAEPHTGLLRRPGLLVVRLGRGSALAWVGALALSGLVYGDIAKSASTAVSESSVVQKALGRLGAHELGVRTVLGLVFLIIAILIAVIAASQVAGTRDEEASGRLDNLLVRPVGRPAWLAGRLAWSTALLVACGLAAGAFAWLAAAQGSGLRIGTMLAAGLNTVAPALFLLGVGTLVHATAPRMAAAFCYGLIGWAFLIEFLGSVVNFSHWVLDTSIFFHMAPAPAANPNWASAGALAGLGLLSALVAGIILSHRDLANA